MVHDFNNYFWHGQAALAAGDASTAFHDWRNCIKALPQSIEAYRQLAEAFRSIGHLSEASNLNQQALKMAPDHPALLADSANLLLDQGHVDTAISIFIQLAHQSENEGNLPDALAFLSNALMGLEYSDAPSHQKKALAQHWGHLALKWVTSLTDNEQLPAWKPKPQSTDPLHIGFLSGDLCDHPVGFLLLPLLQNRTPEKWSPYIYDQGSRQDQTHLQLTTTVPANQWHRIDHLSDPATIEKIISDQLDILIDLSGHTGRSRLRLMAHRLAGRQLCWLGFSGTTGLATIDGVILDTISSEGCADQFVESILPLDPSRFCFRPPFAPPLKPPPSTHNGFISFGSFNNTAKYNHALLATWAAILKHVPNSKLILKWRTFADAVFKHETLATFASFGIEPERIDLRGFSTHRQMLDEYNDIDIALDPFPFNGGYTSLEALWMGLPLVTLSGTTPIGRQSASFLTALNKNTWVGQTPEEYIQIAKALAADPAQLTLLRSTQRYQIMDSALYDAPSFAKNFESLILAGGHIKSPPARQF